jgi:hypothetical protein
MEVRLCSVLALEYPAFKRTADTRKDDEYLDSPRRTQGCADNKLQMCAEDKTAIQVAMLQCGVPAVKGC